MPDLDKRRKQVREAQIRWREANPEKHREKGREYHRKWVRDHPEKAKETNQKWARSHPEVIKENAEKWKADHPSWAKAQKKAREKIPLMEKCERCGNKAQNRHHPDYSKPLDVIHLCSKCHHEVHAKYGKVKTA